MPNTKKILTVQNLAEKFKQASGVVLTDYKGLSVAQMSKLRQDIKALGAEYEVVKNSLLGKAAKDAQTPIDEKALIGSTAALWAYSEDPAVLKALVKFAKENELPKVKFGLWQKQPLSPEKIIQLALLLTRPELNAQLAGTLASPLARLTNALNYNLCQLVYVLHSIGTK
jgi:large subunit ribosomal protein L10